MACTSLSALAEDTVKWADVGAWPVMVDRTLGDGCFTYKMYPTGTILRMGFDRLTDQVYILVANQAWSTLESGKTYDLRLSLGDAQPWNGPGTASNFNGATAFWLNFGSVDVVLNFVQVQILEIKHRNETLEYLDLTGSVAAFSEVLRCQEATNAGRKTSAPTKGFSVGQPN
jgi:hypothetical protein